MFKIKTPAEIVAKAIWNLVYDEWDKENVLAKVNRRTDQLLLKIAYRYLTDIEAEKAKNLAERKKLSDETDRYRVAHDEHHGVWRRRYEWLSEVPEFLSTILATTVIGTIVISAVYAVSNINWIEFFGTLVTEIFAHLAAFEWNDLVFLLLPYSWILVVLLTSRIMFQEPVLAGYPGQFGDFRTLKDVKNDRAIIWSMVGDGKGDSEGIDLASKDDADFELPSRAQPPAIPPGVTELSLKNSDRGVAAIRTSLEQLRSHHHRLTMIFSGGFAASLLVALAGLLFLKFDPRIVLGSGGFMAGTGFFTFVALQSLRSSTYALAIFEGFVSELEEALEFAGSQSSKDRQATVQNAWRNFRIGVNDLHRRDRWIARREQQSTGTSDND